MSTEVQFNGTSYLLPELGEESDFVWRSLTDYLIALSGAGIGGGNLNLGEELNLGSSFGIKSIYYKTSSTSVANIGSFRLAKTDLIVWRNQANNSDLALGLSEDNRLTFNGTKLATVNETAGGSVTTTKGDLIVRGDTEDVRLPRGGANQVLTSDGTDLSWQDPQAVSSSTPTTTRGDLIARGASSDSRLALGADGAILKSDGTDPIWFNPIADISNLSGNYTVQSEDGIHKFIYTLGGSDLSLTLPNHTDKIGRELVATIADDTTGTLTLVGTIDNTSDFILFGQGSTVTLIATSTGWQTIAWQGYQSINKNITTPTITLPAGASSNNSNLKLSGMCVAIKGTAQFLNEIRFSHMDVTLSGAATSTDISINSGAEINLPSNNDTFLSSSIAIRDAVVRGGSISRASTNATENFFTVNLRHESSTTLSVAGTVTFLSNTKPSWA